MGGKTSGRVPTTTVGDLSVVSHWSILHDGRCDAPSPHLQVTGAADVSYWSVGTLLLSS